MSDSVSIFWFRRDLRLADNVGLYHALKGENPVVPIFIFDRNILDDLQDEDDARVMFIHDVLNDLKDKLRKNDRDIDVRYGYPLEVWKHLVEDYNVQSVFCNRDYEPYAKERDESVREMLSDQDIEMIDYKDQVIFEKTEIEKNAGGPYTVFTPYSRKWREKLADKADDPDDIATSSYFKSYSSADLVDNFFEFETHEIPTLESMGFKRSSIEIPSFDVKQSIIKQYDKKRNFPAADATSRLGIHFRFGTISIREKARKAVHLNRTYLNELIWRDFYAQILANYPRVVEASFRAKYDRIEWRNNETEFKAWCEGKTGYPMVDAGMRQLNESGYMHNRVRMITASFLTKHLLIDWRWGEAYFARRLLDYDLASNNGGWQWAAGSGTDAAPYFRIFNPASQQKKFDKDYKYVKDWIPEFETDEYPEPIVDHKEARQRCLDTYKAALDRAD